MKSTCRTALAISLLLVTGLAADPVAAGQGPGKPGEPRHAVPPPTTEPAPPLGLDLSLSELQKNAHGGVASLLLKAVSSVAVGELQISLRAPAGVVFTDGSREKSWTSVLAAGDSVSFPVEVLISKDGIYVITGEARGKLGGKPLHRGVALKLLVGVREKGPKLRDGAMEYPGVRGEGK